MDRKRKGLVGLVLIAAIGWGGYALQKKQDSESLILYGNVDVRSVDIGFRVEGRVATLYFEEGDKVPAGALLAELEKNPYDAEKDKAKADLLFAEIQCQNAKVLLDRRQSLEPVGGVSAEERDDSLAQYKQLQASVAAAKASLKIAEDNLSYTKVFAPQEAIVLTRIKEPGSIVKVSDPVYTLSISSPLWIRAYVDEMQLGSVVFGMEAEVLTDGNPGKVYRGKVGFISPVAEFTPKTVQTTQLRTDLVYRLRIYVEAPDDFLKQGMPVTVRLKKVL